jgi:hypothetical protein
VVEGRGQLQCDQSDLLLPSPHPLPLPPLTPPPPLTMMRKVYLTPGASLATLKDFSSPLYTS